MAEILVQVGRGIFRCIVAARPAGWRRVGGDESRACVEPQREAAAKPD